MSIKISTIRSLYFYVIAAIGLLMVAFSVGDLINLGLKTWVFSNSELIYTSCGYGGSEYPPPIMYEEEFTPLCEKELKQGLERRTKTRQTSAIRDFSMILIGLPLFLFHFRIAQKERKEIKNN